jgi:transcription elongation factor GreA
MVEERSTATHTLRPARALTSAASFRRLQAELKELVEVLQPKNTKAIEEARALGDLSENAEYKSAKELQRELGRRRNAMERQVQNLQPTDFRQQQVAGVVIPGCKLTLQYEGAAEPETQYLLGVLDGDVARHFLSYESPLGQVLVSKRVGDVLKAPNGTPLTIVGIEPLPQEVLDELA